MPELPEVETIVRSLSPRLQGLRISSFQLLFPPLLKNENKDVLGELVGARILTVRRRGKLILIDCEKNLTLCFHLKMTGRILFCPKQKPLEKHTRFIISFEDKKQELRFGDVRKFGFLLLVPTSEVLESEVLGSLGPEPLELDFSSFCHLFKGRSARLKSLLLDQSFVAGIGNIYADEILFRARLHPLTPGSFLRKPALRRLWQSTRETLASALAARGSSIRDYTDALGKEGNYQNFHQVYGRESLPCPSCGEKIARLRLGGRSTFFCPRCQKKKRP